MGLVGKLGRGKIHAERKRKIFSPSAAAFSLPFSRSCSSCSSAFGLSPTVCKSGTQIRCRRASPSLLPPRCASAALFPPLGIRAEAIQLSIYVCSRLWCAVRMFMITRAYPCMASQTLCWIARWHTAKLRSSVSASLCLAISCFSRLRFGPIEHRQSPRFRLSPQGDIACSQTTSSLDSLRKDRSLLLPTIILLYITLASSPQPSSPLRTLSSLLHPPSRLLCLPLDFLANALHTLSLARPLHLISFNLDRLESLF